MVEAKISVSTFPFMYPLASVSYTHLALGVRIIIVEHNSKVTYSISKVENKVRLINLPFLVRAQVTTITKHSMKKLNPHR